MWRFHGISEVELLVYLYSTLLWWQPLPYMLLWDFIVNIGPTDTLHCYWLKFSRLFQFIGWLKSFAFPHLYDRLSQPIGLLWLVNS